MAESLGQDVEQAILRERQEQHRRIQALLARVKLPEAWDYMNESALCFSVGAYDAAVVMCWNAVMCYYRTVAREHRTLFHWAYSRNNQRRQTSKGTSKRGFVPFLPIADSVTDTELIQGCQTLGFFDGVSGVLDELRSLRHRCAHPGVLSLDPDEPIGTRPVARPGQVADLFEQAVDAILAADLFSDVVGRPLTGAKLVDYLMSADRVLSDTEIVDALEVLSPGQDRFAINKMRDKLMHWIASDVLEDTRKEYRTFENMLRTWRLLFPRATVEVRREQLRTIGREIAHVLGKDVAEVGGAMQIVPRAPDVDNGVAPVHEGAALGFAEVDDTWQTVSGVPSEAPRAPAVDKTMVPGLVKLLVFPPDDVLNPEWVIVYSCLLESIGATLVSENAPDMRVAVITLKEYCPTECLDQMNAICDKVNDLIQV